MNKGTINRLGRSALSAFIPLVLSAGMLLGTISAPNTARADAIWDRWQAAERAVAAGKPEDAVVHWKFLVDYYDGVGDWESAALFCGWLDEYYDKAGLYEEAIRYYELENSYWLKLGKDWGAIDIQRAEQIRTTVEAYVSPSSEAELKTNAAPSGGKLAKYEPEYGLYIGLYSEQDPEMGNVFSKAKSVYGKSHAIYLAYSPVGKEFPRAYATRAKEAGGALQIAWEPSNGLDSVVDGDYIRKWAREAKASGIPIFLRYASEMNGNWVPWHGDPAKYIEKFRLVHDIMAAEAPNVAMVWSPSDVPAYSMDPYYPGDEYVDWVGVSLYTEPYENGDPAQDNMQGTSPIERLDTLYKTYSARKPMMLSESAVSHYAHIPKESFTDWAVLNMSRLYDIMPYKYPRLKAITWFNVDLKDRESRNNYLLSANPQMKSAYMKLISSPYYLSKVETGAKPASLAGLVALKDGHTFAQKTRIVPFAKIPDVMIGKIEYAVNGEIVAEQTAAPFGIELQAGQVPDGAKLELTVYNQAGQKAGSRAYKLSSAVSVTINGNMQAYEQPPVIVQGSTLTPLRAIFEAMGAKVEWNAEKQTATATKGATTVSLKIGDKVAYRNGSAVPLETAAQLVNGFTMAPARFVGETFGGQVNWTPTTRTVQITVASAAGSAAKPDASSGYSAAPNAEKNGESLAAKQPEPAVVSSPPLRQNGASDSAHSPQNDVAGGVNGFDFSGMLAKAAAAARQLWHVVLALSADVIGRIAEA